MVKLLQLRDLQQIIVTHQGLDINRSLKYFRLRVVSLHADWCKVWEGCFLRQDILMHTSKWVRNKLPQLKVHEFVVVVLTHIPYLTMENQLKETYLKNTQLRNWEDKNCRTRWDSNPRQKLLLTFSAIARAKWKMGLHQLHDSRTGPGGSRLYFALME